MTHLRYDMQGASEAGIHKHPQEDMKDRCISYSDATPQSISNEWWFWNCEVLPDDLPSYIEQLCYYGTGRPMDPRDQVGFGLSTEMAKEIYERSLVLERRA